MKYITKTDLSLGPQFGSQMFQYAGLLAVSKHLDMPIIFFNEYLEVFRGVQLFEAFDIHATFKSVAEADHSDYILEAGVCDNKVFNLDPNTSWDIKGGLDTYHCWDRYRDTIRNTYKFKESVLNIAENNINNIKAKDDIPLVSIHFRRGDYLEVASLNLTLDYYNQAIGIILEKLQQFKLVVFSDDIEWCKEVIVGDNVYYSEGSTKYVDMCMMSLCDHNITANSTFSWWGAWLNTNIKKVVICPEDYVNDPTCSYINKNYYPRDWIALPLEYTT